MSKLMSKSLCYSGKLLEVKPGHVITICGKTKESAEYFDFFFISDNGTIDDFGDIQFHVGVNFAGSREVVRNSYTKHIGWDSNEERLENLLPNNTGINPVKRGDEFKLTIYADTSMFYLSIDEKPFCTYEYRKPLSEIRRMNIFGDVEQIFQVNHSAAQQSTNDAAKGSTFTGSIPTVKAEMALVFTGVPKQSDNGHFVIGLSEGKTGKFLLQIISKFQTGEVIAISEDENLGHKIIETPQPFPFKNDETFKAAIGFTNSGFVFTVNGQYILRCPIDDNSFLNRPMSVLLTSCEDSVVEVHGVDVFGMEGVGGRATSSMVEKNLYATSESDKMLARVLHH